MLKIKKLTITKLNGYIPVNITFNSNLTFLTGSNGSGKTTVLKLLSAILKPDFEQLNSIQFEEVNLTCWIDSEIYKISLYKNEDSRETKDSRESKELKYRFLQWKIVTSLRLKSKKSTQYEPLDATGAIRLYPKMSDNIIFPREDFRNAKENIRAEFLNCDFYNIINNIGTPILLGIDRKIIGDLQDDNPRIRRTYETIDLQNGLNPSFLGAQSVIFKYVSNIADVKKNLVEEFKLNIFKSLFKYLKFSTQSSVFGMLSESELLKKKNNTISAIKRLELDEDIVDEVIEYFNSLIEVQKSIFSQDEDLNRTEKKLISEWYVNRPHLRRIEAVSDFAEKFQQSIDELDYPLTKIMNIANDFFTETNKRFRIGANGSINVDWANKEISTRTLSSGEIQLIVIIIHLVFCEYQNDKTVFVIDEPELSLHISWQEKFVEAMTKASPGTQFILATHSPAIISKLEYEKNCVYLENV